MLVFPRGHSRLSQRPTASCPSPAGASLCPSNRSCSPRPEGRFTRPLLQPPAPAVRSCETRCLLASRCPAKYRHQVRPAGPNLAAGEGGRRPLPPPKTPPAPLAAVAEAGRGVPGPKPGGGAHAATPLRSGPGCAEGRGRRRRCVRASVFRPLPAALGCGLRCSPSCCCHQPEGAGPDGGRARPERPRPVQRGKVRRLNSAAKREKCACACGVFVPRVSLRPSQTGSGGRPRRLVQSGTRRRGATARDQVPALRIPAAIAQLI